MDCFMWTKKRETNLNSTFLTNKATFPRNISDDDYLCRTGTRPPPPSPPRARNQSM